MSTPESAQELFRNGYDFEQDGRFSEARRAYEMALSSCPDQHAWHYRLGCVFMKMGDAVQAEVSAIATSSC